jgi:sodium/hydrogen antiporter
VGIGFPDALLLLGLVLAAVAALSGWLHGTVLSASVVSLVAGLCLAWAGVLTVRPSSEILVVAVELALLLTLFADGLTVRAELLREHWQPPARALVLALPLTLCAVALCARVLFPQLDWAEDFLLGAILSPTDPVVTSSVVTSERVPAAVRHALNLESGLNDGLALPIVLFLLVLAGPAGHAAREGLHVLGKVGSGALFGAALAFGAGRLLPHLPGGGMQHRYEGVYALGLAFAAFGAAEAIYGNGLIAAFVAGIVLAVSRSDIPSAFAVFNEGLSAAFQIITFVLFGGLIFSTGWHGSAWRVALFVAFLLLVARPAAVWIAFLNVRLARPEKLFIAWFGPKGVASMLFALLVLASSEAHRSTIFELAAYSVVASIAAHGLTDTLGAHWIERRLGDGGRQPGR